MKFDAETLQMFLDDKPFFKNKDCFCLGSTLEEAGDIVSKIVEDDMHKGGTANVGMDIKRA